MGMGGINKAAFLAMYASGFPMRCDPRKCHGDLSRGAWGADACETGTHPEKIWDTGAVGFQYGLRRNNYFMCNYENKNDDRRVLTQKCGEIREEETVKIPAYYQI